MKKIYIILLVFPFIFFQELFSQTSAPQKNSLDYKLPECHYKNEWSFVYTHEHRLFGGIYDYVQDFEFFVDKTNAGKSENLPAFNRYYFHDDLHLKPGAISFCKFYQYRYQNGIINDDAENTGNNRVFADLFYSLPENPEDAKPIFDPTGKANQVITGEIICWTSVYYDLRVRKIAGQGPSYKDCKGQDNKLCRSQVSTFWIRVEQPEILNKEKLTQGLCTSTGVVNFHEFINVDRASYYIDGKNIEENTDISGITPGNHVLKISKVYFNGKWEQSENFVVLPSPVVKITSINSICRNAAPVQLTATVDGTLSNSGTWQMAHGGALSGNVFDPSKVSEGTSQVDITFSYTNQSGCTSKTTSTITIVEPPVVAAPNIDLAYCQSSGKYTLPEGTPAGGFWTGKSIEGTNVLNTDNILSTGELDYYYNYTDPNTGCSNQILKKINIRPRPAVNAGEDFSVCKSDDRISLKGQPLGTTGKWSGKGVIDNTNIFDPFLADVGSNILTYTYTNESGCTYSDNVTVLVNDAPPVNAGIDRQICYTSEPVALTGTSYPGGQWSGIGITPDGQHFDPKLAGIGVFELTYKVKIGQAICLSKDVINITVPETVAVFAGNNFNICQNAAGITLTGQTPEGGTWMGDGIGADFKFYPQNTSVGKHILTYAFTDPKTGCANSATREVNVIEAGTISAGADMTVCPFEGIVQLKDYSPEGGQWTGVGIISGSSLFDPAVAGVGAHTLTYSKMMPSGCLASDTKVIVVKQGSTPNPGAGFTIAENAPLKKLLGVTPGGKWYGPGVSADSLYFNPAVTGAGKFQLYYRVRNYQTNCFADASIEVTVLPVVILEVTPGFKNICFDAAPVTLPLKSEIDFWTGVGIVGTNIFNPSIITIESGENKIINLTYHHIENNVDGTYTSEVTVRRVAAVSAGDALLKVCLNAGIIQLTGASPKGGTWSGKGIINNVSGIFDPQKAGPSATGHVITYTYKDPYGCSASAEKNIVVIEPAKPSAGDDLAFCINAGKQLLIPVTTGGKWFGVGIGSDSTYFDPSALNAGVYEIYYRIKNQYGCYGIDTVNVTVHPIEPTRQTPGFYSTCYDGEIITLPVKGKDYWTGEGIINSWSGDAMQGNTFNPALIEVTPGNNVQVELTYHHLTQFGCESIFKSKVIVRRVVNVSAGDNLNNVCLMGGNILLTGESPKGGSWSGNGIVNALTGEFDPKLAGVSSTGHVITYTYKDPYGCCSTSKKLITVIDPPKPNAGNDMVVCKNKPPFTLKAITSGGIWYGKGVENNNTFNAFKADIGDNEIIYIVTTNGCPKSDTINIKVNDIPIADGGDDFDICINDAPRVLFNGNLGIWSGQGVENNTFYPAKALKGKNRLVFTTKIDETLCSNTDTIYVTVKDITKPNAGNDFKICPYAPVKKLLASPEGGTWMGDGVNSVTGEFDPSLVKQDKYYELVYTYTNPLGCSTSDTVKVFVTKVTDIYAGADMQVCLNDALIDLFADVSVIPTHGKWSGAGVNGRMFDPAAAGVGTHKLKYELPDENGCKVFTFRTVIVNPIPSKPTVKGQTIACDQGAIILYAEQAEPGRFTFEWYKEHEKSPFFVGSTLNYTITKDETLIVHSLNEYGCRSNLYETVKLTTATPHGKIIASRDSIYITEPIQFDFSGKNGNNYSWNFGDGQSSQAKAKGHYYYKPGTYNVVLTVESEQGCINTFEKNILVKDEKILHVDTTNLPHRENGYYKEDLQTSVFPNPFRDKLQFQTYLDKTEDVVVTIRDITGYVVKQWKFSAQKNFKIELKGVNSLYPGKYYIQVQSKSLNTNELIIKL